MNFFDFEKKMVEYPVFTASEAKAIFFEQKGILTQIAFWQKKGYIRNLRKGIYFLSKLEKSINPMVMASKLYYPSYLSLEFALNYYGIIPDIPGTYTAVTTRKTQKFKNDYGNFSYRKVKRGLFSGYKTLQEKNVSFSIATPEKAIMDFLYLNKHTLVARADFWQELRINEEFKFDNKTIENYKTLFKNKKVNRLISSLIEYQKNAR